MYSQEPLPKEEYTAPLGPGSDKVCIIASPRSCEITPMVKSRSTLQSAPAVALLSPVTHVPKDVREVAMSQICALEVVLC